MPNGSINSWKFVTFFVESQDFFFNLEMNGPDVVAVYDTYFPQLLVCEM